MADVIKIEVIGQYKFFIGRDGALYRANVDAPLDTDGYPNGGRFEAPGFMAGERLKMLRELAKEQ